MNRHTYYTPAVIEAEAEQRDARATVTNRPTYLAAYVTDGVTERTFLFMTDQPTIDRAFQFAATRNASRDMNDPALDLLQTGGRRYGVTLYRALWNGMPTHAA